MQVTQAPAVCNISGSINTNIKRLCVPEQHNPAVMTLQVCRDTFTLPGLQSAAATNHTTPDPMPANHSSVLRWDDRVSTNQRGALPPSGLCGHCSNLGHDLIFWHQGPAPGTALQPPILNIGTPICDCLGSVLMTH